MISKFWLCVLGDWASWETVTLSSEYMDEDFVFRGGRDAMIEEVVSTGLVPEFGEEGENLTLRTDDHLRSLFGWHRCSYTLRCGLLKRYSKLYPNMILPDTLNLFIESFDVGP